MDKIKLFALGGLDENGKNLYVVEIYDDIFILDVGSKHPEDEKLGVEVIIPDFNYLVENKKRIKGIFITHAHDDSLGSLAYLIKKINVDIYATAFSASVIENEFKKHGVTKYKIKVIDRNSRFKIGKTEIRTFGLTMSVPDGFGVAIGTEHGYIVYTSEFIFDFNVTLEEFSSSVIEIADLGKEKILILMTESVSSEHDGFTAPSHSITDYIEVPFVEASNRIIITAYEQNIYRITEIIELANRLKKRVFIHDDGLRLWLKKLSELGYYKIPAGIEISKEKFHNDMEDVVIIVSGRGPAVFRKMFKIATHEDELVDLKEDDSIVIASPIAAGTEIEATQMENELYKEGAKVISVNKKLVNSLHASVEDLKMMIYFLSPKYYVPVRGEYRHLVENANVALKKGVKASNIIVLDNGQIATFNDGEYVNSIEHLELEEVLIDGSNNLDSTGFVLRDRETLSTDGVLIIGVAVNFNNKEIIGGPDVQSRGLIYLKDAEHITKEIGVIMENTINTAVSEKRYENMAVRMEAKDKITKYVFKETGKKPMVLPTIIEINIQE